MKTTTTIVLSLCLMLGTITALFAQETLINQSISSLVAAKVLKIIISKIQSSANTFDMSSEGMIGLKTAKVNDQLIEAMLLNCGQLPKVNNDEVIKLNMRIMVKK